MAILLVLGSAALVTGLWTVLVVPGAAEWVHRWWEDHASSGERDAQVQSELTMDGGTAEEQPKCGRWENPAGSGGWVSGWWKDPAGSRGWVPGWWEEPVGLRGWVPGWWEGPAGSREGDAQLQSEFTMDGGTTEEQPKCSGCEAPAGSGEGEAQLQPELSMDAGPAGEQPKLTRRRGKQRQPHVMEIADDTEVHVFEVEEVDGEDN
jgi:hypothetical protein